MKLLAMTGANQLERLARFPEEHPGFSTLLESSDAVGLRGSKSATAQPWHMEKFMVAQPHFDLQHVTLMLSQSARRAEVECAMKTNQAPPQAPPNIPRAVIGNAQQSVEAESGQPVMVRPEPMF